MVVASVVVGCGLGLSELLGGGGLSLGVQVLDLGLAEDADAGSASAMCCNGGVVNSHPGVAGGRLVHVGLVDNKEDLASVLV